MPGLNGWTFVDMKSWIFGRYVETRTGKIRGANSGDVTAGYSLNWFWPIMNTGNGAKKS